MFIDSIWHLIPQKKQLMTLDGFILSPRLVYKHISHSQNNYMEYLYYKKYIFKIKILHIF